MAALVYVLCAFTSFLCAALLWRSYRRVRTGLLFWSSLCFIGLALNNVILVLDMAVIDSVDFSMVRTVITLISVSLLLGSLIWEIL